VIKQLKQALVDSFVGAIALGYALAQCILHFVNIFASPVAGWISRREFRDFNPAGIALARFSLADALPDLARFAVLLLVWYLLMRWLYFSPREKTTSEEPPNPEQVE
jgi:hypothetical protein